MLPKEKGFAPPKENPVLAEGTSGSGDFPKRDPAVELELPKLILGAVEKLDRVELEDGALPPNGDVAVVVLGAAGVATGAGALEAVVPKENPLNAVAAGLSASAADDVVLLEVVADPLVVVVVVLVLSMSWRCFS